MAISNPPSYNFCPGHCISKVFRLADSMSEEVFRFTEKAIDNLKRIIADNNVDTTKYGVRLGLIGGGCNGLTFHMDFEEERPDDNVSHFDGFRVIVDPMSIVYFDGLEVDYNDALIGGGFVFNSNKITSKCGCGSSVSIS